ncbi:YeeE/YedE family protein [Mesorhizobium sp. VK23B]|uniref:YeeE/YedE family protein n=1 Tax=Mesorhizobium dulcispinae TaxID=3072316 RepID=A0ABU4XNW9_9HYPH|nr:MULTISPECIES: DUF6691 family protein [unclassified Mesorhizobium]MDX8469167.1 YeeE/YedE family protein [Mesorhizobium sp. VK23B]MDX8475505.1 YeeE/YedE family protein [Mesorhizobium sp. VK23A]MDX8518092.1 YeeE/YedE family protein [Mesorhizobium sp. VK23D]
MNKLVSAFLIGGLFGLGIAVSGMINPAKVLNFFDIAGTWDPSLIFVMGGGLAVAFTGYRLVFGQREAPVFESAFALPAKRAIDWQLVCGAAIFGIGWGIAGFCPGASIPALGLGYSATPIFVAAVIAGIVAARFARTRFTQPAAA